jgi:hypothetical protein
VVSFVAIFHPFPVLHLIFVDAYTHSKHHDYGRHSYNYSLYFNFWDHICGTYIDEESGHFNKKEQVSQIEPKTRKSINHLDCLFSLEYPLPKSRDRPAMELFIHCCWYVPRGLFIAVFGTLHIIWNSSVEFSKKRWPSLVYKRKVI